MKAQWLTWLLIGVLSWSLPGEIRGQTLLRWKLKPGDALTLAVQQATESQVTFSGKAATTKIDLTVELGWLVAAVDDKGIKIKQTINGVKLKLQSPQGGLIEFDSAATARPTGQAREVADSIQPLIESSIELTMTDRGEVTGVSELEWSATKTPPAGGKAAEPPAVSRGAVEQLLRQSLVVLPEKAISAGDEWQHARNLASSAGEYEHVTTYRLAGMREENGAEVALLEMTSKLAAAAAAPPSARLIPPPKSPYGRSLTVGKLTTKSHEQSGTIRFAVGPGRVVDAEQTQKLVTERRYRDTTIVVTLQSQQKTAVQSASP